MFLAVYISSLWEQNISPSLTKSKSRSRSKKIRSQSRLKKKKVRSLLKKNDTLYYLQKMPIV